MRAILQTDAARGPGYGVLAVEHIADSGEPQIIFRRGSDHATLGNGGWQAGKNSFFPDRWEYNGTSLKIWLGPAVIDNLDCQDSYELEIAGAGSCALEISNLKQSVVLEENGLAAYAPPPASIASESPDPATAVYEGVEATPEVSSGLPADLPGVAAAPAQPRRRRGGCILISLLLVACWGIVGWALWLGVKHSPAPKNGDETFSIEIIPRSTEHTSPDDVITERKN